MSTLGKRIQRERRNDATQKAVRNIKRISTSDAIGHIRSELPRRGQ